MGTTQSHRVPGRGHGDLYGAGVTDHALNCKDKPAPPRGKPSPPSQPVATDITHNSLTLSWQAPRRNSSDTIYAYTVEKTTPSDPKGWTVVTTNCQGNQYQVKNLSSNSQYMFRVRAENIHGVSKGSRPSDVTETKMFGVEQQLYTPAPEDRPHNVPRPRHGINMHLEGAVTSILNHTDIQISTTRDVRGSRREGRTSPRNEGEDGGSSDGLASEDEVDKGSRPRSFSLQRDGEGRSSLLMDRHKNLQRDGYSRSSLQPDRARGASLQREANLRNSLQPSRKKSLPILLPGTRTNSLNKLRESYTFPVCTKARSNETTDFSKRREQMWKHRSTSDAQSSSSGSRECVMNMDNDFCKDESSTDPDFKPPKRDSGLEEDAENPWERDESVADLTDRIISSALEDDVNSGLCSQSPTDSSSGWHGIALQSTLPSNGESGQTDFRTLRSLLHSDNMIVRPTLSLSDVGGGKNISPHNTLSTIMDLEEDEESVRITTL